MLKITILLTQIRLVYTKIKKNELDTNSGGDIDSNKIDYEIANLLSNIKKISSWVNFFSSIASLVFTQKRKILTKIIILFYFDLKYYISIKI